MSENVTENLAKKVRTRFAPSPTGSIHIGSIQKILYSYACAKTAGGNYVLRIEDTDRTRYVEGAEQEILDVHQIIGIKPDESPAAGGPFAPYRQSERLDLYKQYAEQLIEAGHAYYAFETPEELAAMRERQQAEKKVARYQGMYRDFPLADAKAKVANGEKYVVRIKLEKDQEIEFEDIIMGKIKVNSNDLDDYILLKSDGFPTYHLAVVVDDYLMNITHVFRGVEWIATAPIHVKLYDFFGWERPAFAHIPNILDPKGGKLSKRSGSVAVMDFIKEGYLPEAILNFMMLLGWSPKTEQEIFSLEEFVKIFSLKNFNKSNPVFNRDKLKWFNQKYIRSYSPAEFKSVFINWFKTYHPEHELHSKLGELSDDNIERILTLESERVEVLKDLLDKFPVFIDLPSAYDFEHKQVKKLSREIKLEIIERYKADFVSSLDSHDTWEALVRSLSEELQLKPGEVFMTLRIALTGQTATPPLFDIIEIVGVEKTTQRLEAAINYLTAQASEVKT